MAKFKVLKPFCLGRGVDVEAGQEIETPADLTAAYARAKVATGWIEPIAEDETDPGAGETDPAEGETDPAEGETEPEAGETDPAEDETQELPAANHPTEGGLETNAPKRGRPRKRR